MRISIIQDKLLRRLKKKEQKDDISRVLENDPAKFEERRLKELEKQKIRDNISRTREIYSTLPEKEIKYLGSQELDLSSYLKDRRIDVFKKLLEAYKDGPIYLHLSHANKEEIIAIRDAMIVNPRITLFCLKSDYYSLWEAFHQGGYSPALVRKVVSHKGTQLLGIIFIGTCK